MTSRRDLLASVAGAATLAFGHRSEAGLAPTPSQPAGPFYPLTLPAHPGNDLIRVAGRAERAKGVVTYVGGRIFDKTGRPIPGARVEIWQCDAEGRYHNVDDGRDDRPLDPNFQGFGRTVTDATGGYRFRTIRPVPYPGRAPHIHFIVSASGLPRLVTQMYVAGDPRNRRDGLLMSIRDAAARALLIVTLRPAPQIEANALAGTFDIVLDRG